MIYSSHQLSIFSCDQTATSSWCPPLTIVAIVEQMLGCHKQHKARKDKASSFVNNKSKSYLSISLVENPDLKVDLVVQIINKLHAHFVNNCSVAQRKRVGLITQRSQDRNLVEQLFSASVPERSKGLDSSSSVFVLEGSNPSRCIPFY